MWNCPDQTANLNMNWNELTIGGNVTIQNTGSAQLEMSDPEAGKTAVVNISGDFIQSGGAFTATATNEANTVVVINHLGNIQITEGDFSICRGSQGGSGTTTWNIQGNVFLENATTQNSNTEGAKFVFCNAGNTQMLSISGVIFAGGGFPVEIDSAVTLDMGTSVLQGEGSFHLNSGATLMCAHVDGIDGSVASTGKREFDEGSNYVFNGALAQFTGNLLPDNVRNLTINNSNGVTLSKNATVHGTLDVVDGSLSSGANVLSYGPGASLKYSGSTLQTTAADEFPVNNGPTNLVIANPRSVKLHDSRTIHFLDLQRKLDLGANTLTADTVSDAAYNAYVITTEGGVLKNSFVGEMEAFFPVGTNTYSPVWVKNSGTADAVNVGVILDTLAPSDGNSLRIKWIIGEDIPGGGNYTIQFGWSTSQEGSAFKEDRESNARIYNLTDTTEAGSGDYTMQFSQIPYTLSRGGITDLGPFGIGGYASPTGIAENSEAVSTHGILYPNYPNPFSDLTIIRFAISNQSFVSLKVYNIIGEEIVDLAGKMYSPGVHSEIFDASQLSGGIYFLSLQVNDLVQTRRMVLIK